MRECPTCLQVFERICLDCANKKLTDAELREIVKEIYNDDEYQILLDEEEFFQD